MKKVNEAKGLDIKLDPIQTFVAGSLIKWAINQPAVATQSDAPGALINWRNMGDMLYPEMLSAAKRGKGYDVSGPNVATVAALVDWAIRQPEVMKQSQAGNLINLVGVGQSILQSGKKIRTQEPEILPEDPEIETPAPEEPVIPAEEPIAGDDGVNIGDEEENRREVHEPNNEMGEGKMKKTEEGKVPDIGKDDDAELVKKLMEKHGITNEDATVNVDFGNKEIQVTSVEDGSQVTSIEKDGEPLPEPVVTVDKDAGEEGDEGKDATGEPEVIDGEADVAPVESVIREANDCKNYRADTETCRTGCPKEDVAAGDSCSFYPERERGKYPGDFQSSCPCYNGGTVEGKVPDVGKDNEGELVKKLSEETVANLERFMR